MINVILPLKSEFEAAKKFIQSIKDEKICFYVGLTSQDADKIKASKRVKVFVYKDGSKLEEMINSLAAEVEEGKIIVLRNLITKQELENLISSDGDITIFEGKKRGKVANFFYKMWKFVVERMFDIKLFDGNMTAVALSEDMSAVARNIKNLSYATRINRWKGVKVKTIQSQSAPAKLEYDRIRSIGYLAGFSAMLAVIIASTAVYFALCKATFLAGFGFACALLIGIVCFTIALMVHILNVKIGDRRFDFAKKEEK